MSLQCIIIKITHRCNYNPVVIMFLLLSLQWTPNCSTTCHQWRFPAFLLWHIIIGICVRQQMFYQVPWQHSRLFQAIISWGSVMGKIVHVRRWGDCCSQCAHKVETHSRPQNLGFWRHHNVANCGRRSCTKDKSSGVKNNRNFAILIVRLLYNTIPLQEDEMFSARVDKSAMGKLLK